VSNSDHAAPADAVAPMPPSWYSHDDLEFKPQRFVTTTKRGIVRGPYNYVISHPGKDIRSAS